MESQQEEPHSAERKVRFDLNHEVFLIPNKWERLSKAVSKEKFAKEGPAPKNKTRTQGGRDSRKKGKQKRQANFKKSSNDLSPPVDESHSKYAKTSRTPTPSKDKVEGKKAAGIIAKESGVSASRVDSKFKLSHRTAKELPRVDIVLPKISYTHDLKKAIEVAIRSNRSAQAEESRLKQFEAFERPRSLSEGSSDASLSARLDQVESPQNMQGQGEGRFSELSRRVDGWNPFPAWREANMNQVLHERGKVLSSLIPNSILY